MSPVNLFAYGTLMFPEVWHAVAGRRFRSAKADMRGFRIFRVADADFPGILAGGEHDTVAGVIYFDIDPDTLRRLDAFEDVFYVRERHRAGDTPCEVYVVPPERKEVLTNEFWSAEHFAEHHLDAFVARCFGPR